MASELSALSRATSPHSKFEFAKVNRPKHRPDQAEAEVADEQLAREVGSNKQLNDYVNFLEMLRANGARNVGSLETAREEVAISAAVEAEAISYSGPEGEAIVAAVHGELHASISGEYFGADGAEYRFEASIDITVDIAVAASSVAPSQSDPLALDLNGDGEISLTDITSGVAFDINADGVMDRTAFIGGGDGFLAWDRDRNGVINDGAELFGDQRGAANGYLELARYDDDKNGIIDDRDRLFAELLVASAGTGGVIETRTAAAAGVKSISLAYQEVNERAAGGNTIAQRGSFEATDGTRRESVDALLQFVTSV